MPTSAAQSVGTDLRAGIRRSQLRISARAINEGRHAQSVERDSERTGVDRGRRLKRLFRVGGSCEASDADRTTRSRWPGATPHTGNAEGRKLWSRTALSQ